MSVIGKNLTWLLMSQVLTWVVSLVILTTIPDLLGPDGFGTVNYALAYVGFFQLLAGLGSSTFLAREIARDHSITGLYVFNAMAMKVVLVTVLSVVAIGLAIALGNDGETLLLITVACLGMYIGAWNEVFGGSLSGMQRMAKPAMWQTVQVYVQSLVGLFAVAVLGWGAVVYGSILVFSVLISTVACGLMLLPFVRGHCRLDWQVWKRLVLGGLPLLALVVFNVIYMYVDVPILHFLAGANTVGWYAVALRWVNLPVFISTAVVTAFFPALAAHGKSITDEFVPLVNRALRLVAIVTVPAALGIALVGDELIHFFYDDTYDQAIPLIRILAVFVPIAAMDTVLATALIAADRMHRYIAVSAVAAVVNPIGCVILINWTDDRYGNGAIGAAIMTVATELIVVFGALRLRQRGVLDATTSVNLLRILAASATMVPVVLLTNGQSLFVQAAAGAVCYGIAAVALGAVTIAELRRVGQLMTDTFGRLAPGRKGDGGGGGGELEHASDGTAQRDE